MWVLLFTVLCRRVRSGAALCVTFRFGAGRRRIFGGVFSFFGFAVTVGACFAVGCPCTATFVIGDMPAGTFEHNTGRLNDAAHRVATLRAYAHRFIRKLLKYLELMPTRIAAINIRRHTFAIILLILHNHYVLYRSHGQWAKQSKQKRFNIKRVRFVFLFPIPCCLFLQLNHFAESVVLHVYEFNPTMSKMTCERRKRIRRSLLHHACAVSFEGTV